ncbi:type II toxin-antitoxin system RelE/ParE family toxin [Flavobacterium sp. J372]|uniref:type II toxin-antitoxin system RelE/ParE family toxin n=1 Tax=Flavobacterium sp. J372 TaxID=2898436 RepID=UPI00215158F1|nr:type II toxin-antitoxin system RelE/ParE family toxin [Flavobacterium sp. J372]MCR5861461.1 type II toxin-antitoxin system RelE/ParE family toxin [Flavobacterium sp. J372]
MKGYRISRKALEDIDTIWIYTKANWSVNQANRYYKLIYQEIDYIVEDFESGKDISDIKPGYRQAKVKSHFIIYRKGEDNAIEIVRILHQMMDIPNRL